MGAEVGAALRLWSGLQNTSQGGREMSGASFKKAGLSEAGLGFLGEFWIWMGAFS